MLPESGLPGDLSSSAVMFVCQFTAFIKVFIYRFNIEDLLLIIHPHPVLNSDTRPALLPEKGILPGFIYNLL